MNQRSDGSHLVPNPVKVETIDDRNTGNGVDGRSSVQESAPIDARTSVDPKVEAEQRLTSEQGAPGSVSGRVALLESAIQCDLPKFLLESVLENATLKSVKDPASTKVHAVDLLKLLTKDPGYGMKFELLLKAIPAWKKYKAQDHSLFITGPEQKADYFLTDGGATKESKKLLTHK